MAKLWLSPASPLSLRQQGTACQGRIGLGEHKRYDKEESQHSPFVGTSVKCIGGLWGLLAPVLVEKSGAGGSGEVGAEGGECPRGGLVTANTLLITIDCLHRATRLTVRAQMLRRRVNLTTRVALRSNGADPTSGFSFGKLEQEEQDQ